MTKIVQVVPYLPPAVSGVGDYALLLARQLRASHGIDSHFLLVNRMERVQTTNEFSVEVIPPRARFLADALREKTPVCLHYVGYGYQKRGCPVWISRAIRTWSLQKDPKQRLITVFHELFATGAMWNS